MVKALPFIHPHDIVVQKQVTCLQVEKDFFSIMSWVWDKEKIASPNEESNLRPSDSALQCSTTEP